MSVTADGKSAATDSDGKFRLDGIASGSISIAFSKSGYEPFQTSVNIVAGQSQNVGDKWLTAKVLPTPATVPTPAAAKGSVVGKLHEKSASGVALSGAIVTAGGKSTSTDNIGSFRLDGISTGNTTVAISKSGYEPFQVSVNIVAGQSQNVGDKWLIAKVAPAPAPAPPPVAATGSVSGRLHKTSASGPVLAGVAVTSGGKSVTTDKDGKFKLEGIPVGNATIAFSITGYEAYQGSVSIVAGRTADLGERWLSEKTISISRSKPINAASGKNIFDSYGLVVEKQYHAGVDYPAPHGTPVFAVMSGKVKTVPMPAGSDNHCMGNIIFLPHENGRQYYLYAHLSKIMVKDGDSVKAGDAIGAVGDTGFNLAARERCRLKSSAHLHLELKDSPVLHNPKGTPQVWGYTPGHATDFGYADPTK